ncbi:MAG: ABC transporter permease subunit [Sphingobacteriales bacterium]|nr:MAG: ABC transporter permease subunit [Sphingobacteriales bacterium]
MNKILIIAKRELSTFFDSLIAYILLVVFLGFSGFFTWLYGSDVFLSGQASIQPFFSIAYWTLFFFIPALTMKMFAEERNTGTIELLLTKAVSDWDVIFGKFFACLALVGIAIAFSLPWYLTVWWLGPVDHGAVWCGYLGLLLMSCTYIGIGLFASSITNSQIVAFLLSLLIGVFFLIIFQVLANSVTGLLSSVFDYMSISNHFESISRGVLDSKNIFYFLSITAVCLIATEAILSRRKIME